MNRRSVFIVMLGMAALGAVMALPLVRAADRNPRTAPASCCMELAAATPAPAESAKPPEPVPMAKPGKKISFAGHSFIYSFDQKPAMGNIIVKVELETADGTRDTSLEVKGDVDMPSMRGMHSTGDRPFQLSKKGDYLLPIGIVMPGEWELVLTFVKDGTVLYRGAYRFNV